MAKNKKLTVTEILNNEKQLMERYTVEVKGFDIEIDKVWRKSKINKLISEMFKNMSEAKVDQEKLNEVMLPYLYIQLIKHFTSINIPDKMDEQIKILNALIDQDLLMPIFEAFPMDEVEKVFDHIQTTTNQVNKHLDDFNAKQEEIAKEMEAEKPLQ